MDTAVQYLSKKLISLQRDDGCWPYSSRYDLGSTALSLLALKYAEVENSHPAVQKAVNYIIQSQPRSNGAIYNESLVLCAFELVGQQPRFDERMKLALDRVECGQLENGCWSYDSTSNKINRHYSISAGGDGSNAQFAILGLAAAEAYGLEVSEVVKTKAIKYWEDSQRLEGGWGYVSSGSSQTFTMTCAGLASLSILGKQILEPKGPCGEYSQNNNITNGLKRLELFLNSNVSISNYGLYALERVGIFLDLPRIGGIDWYQFGLKRVMPNYKNINKASEIAFVLMFLAKAHKQLAITKCRWGDGSAWNCDVQDAKNWAKETGESMNIKLESLVSDLSADDLYAAKASMIFLNGHDRLTLTTEQMDFMRSFLEKDGVVVLEACCGRKEFASSAVKLFTTKFTEDGRFRRISQNHEFYSYPNRIKMGNNRIYQLVKGCRKFKVFLLCDDISCALNGEKVPNVSYKKMLANNILTYAIRSKNPGGKLQKVIPTYTPLVKNEKDPFTDLMKKNKNYVQPLARIRFDGDWNPDPTFVYATCKAMQKTKFLPVYDGVINCNAESPQLFTAPAAILTGHGKFEFSSKSVENLRNYFNNGGLVVATACCGDQQFDASLRAAIKTIFPSDELSKIPFADAIYRYPFHLKSRVNNTTRKYKETYGEARAQLYGIKRNNRWIFIYSAVDLCCDLEGDLDPDKVAYKKREAALIWSNILSQPMLPVETDEAKK